MYKTPIKTTVHRVKPGWPCRLIGEKEGPVVEVDPEEKKHQMREARRLEEVPLSLLSTCFTKSTKHFQRLPRTCLGLSLAKHSLSMVCTIESGRLGHFGRDIAEFPRNSPQVTYPTLDVEVVGEVDPEEKKHQM